MSSDRLDRPDSPPSAGRRKRRAERLTVHEGVVVQLDGNPAMLVDLSTVGAQVLSPTALRPGQRVRMSMVDEESSLRFGATVVWASFELSSGKGFTGYRAGINFVNADRDRVAAFCNRNRKTAEVRETPRPVEPPPPIAAAPSPKPSTDARTRRRARRFAVRERAVVQLDGNRIILVDLSSSGAQVISPVALRPGQHVRMVMGDQRARLRVSASVVWASFEPSGGDGITGYRAGLHFTDADREQVAAFGARNRQLTDTAAPVVAFPPVPSATPGGPIEETEPLAPHEAAPPPATTAPPITLREPDEGKAEQARPAAPPQPAPDVDTPAPPKRKARKQKAAKREKRPSKATKQKRTAPTDQLRGLPAGAHVVIKVGRKKQTVTLVKVKQNRFLATTAIGEELDLSAEQFVRVEQ